MKSDIKWRTELEIVEGSTGEIIPRYLIEQDKYIIIKKEKRNEITETRDGKKGRRIITWITERNPQQKLF